MKPASVMLTNVMPSSWGANTHSTVVGPLYPGHSMTMCLFGSMAFTVTEIEMLYISQSHWTCLPASSLPLPLVNQNFVVMSGLTKASNTSATGLRISIPVFVTGTCLSCRLSILSPMILCVPKQRPSRRRRARCDQSALHRQHGDIFHPKAWMNDQSAVVLLFLMTGLPSLNTGSSIPQLHFFFGSILIYVPAPTYPSRVV